MSCIVRCSSSKPCVGPFFPGENFSRSRPPYSRRTPALPLNTPPRKYVSPRSENKIDRLVVQALVDEVRVRMLQPPDRQLVLHQPKLFVSSSTRLSSPAIFSSAVIFVPWLPAKPRHSERSEESLFFGSSVRVVPSTGGASQVSPGRKAWVAMQKTPSAVGATQPARRRPRPIFEFPISIFVLSYASLINFVTKHASSPSMPSSDPCPLSFTPPNGDSGTEI